MQFTNLMELIGGFLEANQQIIISEFHQGKRFILTEVRLRITCFNHEPLKGLSIGHRDIRKARAGMIITLALYRRRPQSAHPFIVKVYGNQPGSMLHSVLAVIHGDNFAAHPDLLEVRHKAMLASSSEIGIERDHAQMHRNLLLASNHSEAYASLSMRKGEIVDHMETGTCAARQLANILDSVSTPQKALAELDLLAHPSLAHLQDDNDGHLPASVPQHLACRAIYRGDLTTQFGELPNMFGDRPQPPAPPGAPWPPVPPPAAQ